MLLKFFADSDVVISSLISSKGAAYQLFTLKQLQPVISSLSRKELLIVISRLNLDRSKFAKLLESGLTTVDPGISNAQVKKKYWSYVADINDAHIPAGAIVAKTRYLISYNLKHFKSEKIKEDFGIIVTTPALFLQYYRSLV